jgi:hypothetical protein
MIQLSNGAVVLRACLHSDTDGFDRGVVLAIKHRGLGHEYVTWTVARPRPMPGTTPAIWEAHNGTYHGTDFEAARDDYANRCGHPILERTTQS